MEAVDDVDEEECFREFANLPLELLVINGAFRPLVLFKIVNVFFHRTLKHMIDDNNNNNVNLSIFQP